MGRRNTRPGRDRERSPPPAPLLIAERNRYVPSVWRYTGRSRKGAARGRRCAPLPRFFPIRRHRRRYR